MSFIYIECCVEDYIQCNKARIRNKHTAFEEENLRLFHFKKQISCEEKGSYQNRKQLLTLISDFGKKLKNTRTASKTQLCILA